MARPVGDVRSEAERVAKGRQRRRSRRLEAAGVEMDDHQRLSTEHRGTEGSRFEWKILAWRDVDPFTRTYITLATIRQRVRWRQQYEQAARRHMNVAPWDIVDQEVSRHGASAHR